MTDKYRRNNYIVFHIASVGDIFRDEALHESILRWLDLLEEVSNGDAAVCGTLDCVWTPAHVDGEKTRAYNIRWAEALDELAKKTREFADELRDPDFIYEDELSE